MTTDQHITVLLHETIDALNVVSDGSYIDGTFGRGGHSRLLLSRLGPEGKLLAIDRDPRAIKEAEKIQDARFCVVHERFSQIKRIAQDHDLQGKINGILFDLGVSSPQLDDPSRGFSFMSDGPLDMRMDPTRGISAAQWLNSASFEDIAWVLKEFGEEKCAKKIARAIVEDRVTKPYTRTLQLAQMISRVVKSKEHHKNPATRSFQAIRIYINSELEEIRQALSDSIELLAPGGRIAVISFHSLEDRIVKQFFRQNSSLPEIPPGLPVRECDLQGLIKLKLVGKPIKPSDEEIEKNQRSRSALLRVAQKVGECE